MKIAFLAAANSIHGIRWIKFFAERGHEVTWISLAPSSEEAADVIKKTSFYEIAPSPLSDIGGWHAFLHVPAAVKRVKKILREKKPDILHTHSAGTYGLIGALSGFHPLVLTPWGSDILLTSALKKPLVKYIVGRADAYTCDGENTKAKLNEFGAEPNKIHLIRFGTDVEKFSTKGGAASGGKIQNSKFKIISLRSLEPVYDVETLIRAAAIVAKAIPAVEFLIAGEGSQREHLQRIANDLQLTTDNVKFIGRIKNDDLPALLQSSDIYVSTSLSDSGLAASTAEAMACGLPVIVSDSGDNKEWVESEFVIPAKSPDKLAEKILSLLKNKATRESFGARNRKIIEEKNNYYLEMGKAEKLYEKVSQKKF